MNTIVPIISSIASLFVTIFVLHTYLNKPLEVEHKFLKESLEEIRKSYKALSSQMSDLKAELLTNYVTRCEFVALEKKVDNLSNAPKKQVDRGRR